MDAIRSLIREVPDYPKPGILFYDITPVLGDPQAFDLLIDALAEPFLDAGVTKVAGIEARGFTLAAPVAARLEAGFIPIRKPGKLPHDTAEATYELEYGTDALEVHLDAADHRDRVLVVDDVIATGGTARAALSLLDGIGTNVAGFAVFIELGFLNGIEALDGLPHHVLLRYD